MQKNLHINKNLVIILASLILFSGISFYFVAPTVFGGGAGVGGGAGSGRGCGSCSGTVGIDGRPANSSNAYRDTNGNGRADTGEPMSGRNGGGGGGGGGRNGEGGGTVQPRACVLTLSASVIAAGTPSVQLSWTPAPNGDVELTRSLAGSGSSALLDVPYKDIARSYTDVTSSLLPGTYTYSLWYQTPRGSVRGESTSTVEESVLSPEGIQLEPVSSFFDKVLDFVLSFTTPVYASHGGTGKSADSGGDHSGGGNAFGGNSGGGGSSTSGNSYFCTAPLKVVATLTQCNDGLDNSDTEDTLIDQQDPGCHTDGNPGNTKTYDPTDTSEGNPNADLVPTITAVNTTSIRRPVRVTASVKNTSAYYAVSNSLIYGWRDTSSKAKAPNCGKGGKNCFTENGHKFLRLNTYTKAYNAGQTRTDKARTFRPLVKGQYEVCAIADYTNTVTEGSAGEANNSTCRTIVVTDDTTTTTTSTVDGPLTITASPAVMRKGQTSTVTWDTGGRTMCTITNSTSQAISFTDIDGDPRMDDQEETPPLTTQTTYTITCTDPGFEATETATIRLLPDFREI